MALSDKARQRLEAARAKAQEIETHKATHGGARRGGDTDLSTELNQRKFLAAYVETGAIVERAAALAGVPKENHYRWLRTDPDYPQRVQEAFRAACDAIEAEIKRRGQDGYREPVFYKGEKVATVRRFSDTLLIFRAKALMPEKYRERTETEVKGQINHAHSGTLAVAAVRQSLLDDPEYLEFQRQRALREDLHAGNVCPGDLGRSLENGAPPEGARPGVD